MNSLFAIIHSLTPSEKRYFKLFSQRQVQSKNTNYLKLFDAINDQELYNETELLKKFRRETFIKQFAVTKNYLFQNILKSMREYNEESFIEWKVRNQYLQIKILASKGLDEEAEKLIMKTKELAWQYEYYTVILDIIDVEKYLFGNCRIHNLNAEIFHKIEQEEALAAEITITYTQLRNVWHHNQLLELESNVLPKEVIRTRALENMNVDCMQKEPAISYNSKFRYYSTWAFYYNLIDNQEKNYECCKKGILIREEQIEKESLLNMDPLASYYNFLIACEKANIWEEYAYYLNKIKEYKATTIEVNIRRMHNYSWCGLSYYLHKKNYIKAYEVVKEYKSFFIDKSIRFRKDFKIYIETACGLVCLFNKNYKEAVYWWNEILNKPNELIELRQQGSLRLYLMILHFEEGNVDIIDYVSAQAKKFLQKNALWQDAEKIFIKQMIAAAKQPDKKERKKILKLLCNNLQGMELSITTNAVNKFILNWLEDQTS